MHIAVILSENEPFSLRGGANSRKTFEIFRRFPQDHHINVFSPSNGQSPYDCPQLTHQTVFCGRLRKWLPFAKLSKHLYIREIAFRLRHRFDVIYVLNRPEFVPTLKKRHPHSKLVLHLGNDHLITLDTAAGRRIIDDCDLIIGVSRHLCAGILQKFPDAHHKVQLAYNGVNTQQFYPRPAAADKKDLVVLFLGRLRPEKGIHLLISAMDPIFRKFPNVRLKIVGSSWFAENGGTPYVRKLRALAKPAGDKIEFVGYVRNDQVADYYRQADIFVAPSLWNEPFGNVNLEAMASGLPVISSRRGGIPEVVADAGILIDPENVPDLNAQLDYLISNESARQRLSETARTRALTHFSWDQVSHQIEKALLDLSHEASKTPSKSRGQ
jgi:glycosyltransferase involved in cell wall biosynthesis